jgi:hypothetical protein
MNTYRHPEWIRFRVEVIKLDGERCVRCQRSRSDGVILQVHHKSYLPGRLPWEYGHTECETLCKGCHAQEHGIIMPQSDWILIASDDLGDLCGECEYCGTELRYIFAIMHPKWGSMAVGTDCCDRLTMSREASEYHQCYIKKREKRARFIGSKRWRWCDDAWRITQQGIKVCITLQAEKYRISMGGVVGNQEYDNIVDAKLKAYDFIDAGNANELLAQYRQRRRRRNDAEALVKLRAYKPDKNDRKLSYYC